MNTTTIDAELLEVDGYPVRRVPVAPKLVPRLLTSADVDVLLAGGPAALRLAQTVLDVLAGTGFRVVAVVTKSHPTGVGLEDHCDGWGDVGRDWFALSIGASRLSDYLGGSLRVDGLPPVRLGRGDVAAFGGDRLHGVDPTTAGTRLVVAVFAASPRLSPRVPLPAGIGRGYQQVADWADQVWHDPIAASDHLRPSGAK